MIKEYHRPKTLDAALALLSRPSPKTAPLGGGTSVRNKPEIEAVVDLQDLGLGEITLKGSAVDLGAMVRLQSIVDSPLVPAGLRAAALEETGSNLRNMVTVGGLVAGGDGTSLVKTLLVTMDAEMHWAPADQSVGLGDWLSGDRQESYQLITQIGVPKSVDARYYTVRRSPADVPLVIVAVCRWQSGRIRIAGGGRTRQPFLISDGKEGELSDQMVAEMSYNSHSHYDYQWASSEYYLEILKRLIVRGVQPMEVAQ